MNAPLKRGVDAPVGRRFVWKTAKRRLTSERCAPTSTSHSASARVVATYAALRGLGAPGPCIGGSTSQAKFGPQGPSTFVPTPALSSLQRSDNLHQQNWSGKTQSSNEVNAWACSNASPLLQSGKGYDKAVYQELLAALLDTACLRQRTVQGKLYPESLRTLPQRKRAHPGGQIRSIMKYRDIRAVSLCAATACRVKSLA